MGKVYVAESRIHGQGVFAAVTLKPGEPVIVLDDSREVTPEDPLRPEDGEHRRFCDFLMGGRVVLMQPPERYINHSCSPNVFVKTFDGLRYVIALKMIYMTEELTFDYCINSRGDTLWLCNCGSPRCRHTVHSNFFQLPFLLQLEYLPLLDTWFVRENQDQIQALLQKALR